MRVPFGWPIGLSPVDHIDGDIWEVRTRLASRIARVLFVVGAVKAVPPGGRRCDGTSAWVYREGQEDAETGSGSCEGSIETNERYEMSSRCIGSDFDEFLREEEISEEVEAVAIKKVLACMIEQTMAETHITKSEMARRMGTSRTQLDRLLDPANPSVTLSTVAKAAKAIGKKISISFEEIHSVKTA